MQWVLKGQREKSKEKKYFFIIKYVLKKKYGIPQDLHKRAKKSPTYLLLSTFLLLYIYNLSALNG